MTIAVEIVTAKGMASYLLRRAAQHAPRDVWNAYKDVLKAGSAVTAYYYATDGQKKVYTKPTRIRHNPYRKWPRTAKRSRKGTTRTVGYYGKYTGRDKEQKFHDLDMDVTITTSGQFTQLNLIAQGVTESTRVGRKAFIKKIMIRGSVFLAVTSDPANTSNNIRMIVFIDKQCNGVAATAINLLQSDDYQAFRALVNSGRFTVLTDKYITLHASAGAWDGTNDNFGEVERPFFFSHNCNIPIEYDNTTGAITGIATNNIQVMWIASHSINSLVKSKVRLRFTD